MSSITITVNAWDKYNPKRAQNTYTWLRLNNDIAVEPKLFGLTPAQKYVWILVLCECSRANSGTIKIKLEYLAHLSGVAVAEIEKLFQHMREVGLVTTPGYTTLHHGVADLGHSLHLRDETNETNERTKRECITAVAKPPPLPRLVELWNEHRGPKLAEVRKTNKARNAKIARRWPENDEEEWVRVIQRVAASGFCTGDNDRSWRATFDWLLQPESHLRIMEGKYDTRGKESSEDKNRAALIRIFGEEALNE